MTTPSAVRLSAATWAVAVGAGVVESALAVGQIVRDGGLGPGDWANIALRLVVYSLAAFLVVRFHQGRRGAWYALTGLLTVVGLASMVVPAAGELASGHTLVEALGNGGQLGWTFVTVRLLHISCVVVASVAMYAPAANRYFAATRTRRPDASHTAPTR